MGDLRTEQEVAEAFFSAGNGNMEMLNNMLGTQYKTFEEAQKGIAENQGGLVEEMSTTIPGLISTITGKVKTGLKDFVKVFQEPLANAFSGVIGFIDMVSPKIQEFAGRLVNIDFGALFSSFDFSTVTTALQPVFDLFSNLFSAIETRSPAVQGWMNILGTVFNTVWTMIGAVIQAVTPVIQGIFTFIGQHSSTIQNVIQTLGKIWSTVWKTIGVLLQAAWGILEPILSGVAKALDVVCSAVQTVCTWWEKLTNWLSKPLNAVVNVTQKLFGGGKEGNNAFGSGRIAKDNTLRNLHEGEKVLTKRQTDEYLKGENNQGVTVQMQNVVVREEADINKIAKALVRELRFSKESFGGAY